jgi:long-subunit acyl-CoA synthetase (AMP-forming)
MGPSAHSGFIATFEDNATRRGQDAAVSWIAHDAHAGGRGDEVDAAREALRQEFALQQEAAAVPAAVQLNACRAREGVWRDLRTSVGLDKAVMPSCSAAPLRPDVTLFFASLAIVIHQGDGLTETCGPAVADRHRSDLERLHKAERTLGQASD